MGILSRLAAAAVGALFATGLIATADDANQTVEFHLITGIDALIYQQSSSSHPAPTFLICADGGSTAIELLGKKGTLATLTGSNCVYLSDSKISARLDISGMNKAAQDSQAHQAAEHFLQKSIEQYEAISEPTERDVMLLESFKKRRSEGFSLLGPPSSQHVYVTLVR